MTQVLYTINEVRSVARVCRTAIYEAIKNGELRAIKNGRSTRIHHNDLMRWIESFQPMKADKAQEAAPAMKRAA